MRRMVFGRVSLALGNLCRCLSSSERPAFAQAYGEAWHSALRRTLLAQGKPSLLGQKVGNLGVIRNLKIWNIELHLRNG